MLKLRVCSTVRGNGRIRGWGFRLGQHLRKTKVLFLVACSRAKMVRLQMKMVALEVRDRVAEAESMVRGYGQSVR